VKTLTCRDFFFDELVYASTCANVEDVTKWINATEDCPGACRAACSIRCVDEKYYHLEGSEYVLNTPAYIAGPFAETGDLVMEITATQGCESGTCIVIAVSSGKIDNKH
jgi:hypothetical protein